MYVMVFIYTYLLLSNIVKYKALKSLQFKDYIVLHNLLRKYNFMILFSMMFEIASFVFYFNSSYNLL